MKIMVGAQVRWSEEGLNRLMPSTRNLLHRVGDVGIVEHIFEHTVAVYFGRNANGRPVRHNISLSNVVLVELPDPPPPPKPGTAIEEWIRWALDRIDYRAAVACERIRLAAN